MAEAPLLVFDFDGVLVDGMAEYWWSARRAALALRPERQLPEQAPAGFSQLRPLIHKGWEMVLAALELSRAELNLPAYLADYNHHLQSALQRWQLEPQALQQALEQLRAEAIQADPDAWLALHHPYPGVIQRLEALEAEGSPWRVLTTKGGAFARQLLEAYGLQPEAVDGHEQGSKPEVLLQLSRDQARPIWFVEDRRPTLESVRATPGLEGVRCFLVAWGYLAPGDLEQLPAGISPLQPEQFAAPLASWP
jgi:phosphoglycolate phosphatase-like HAD superfamily hydrolase